MAITHKALRMQAERREADCDTWNAAHPVGTPVMVKLDGQNEPIATRTRSRAQILSGHSVVIWLEGISGCYLLSHVRAANTAAEQAVAAADLTRRLAR